MKLQSVSSFPFNLQQFNQAACACTRARLRASSWFQAFLFARLGLEKKREGFTSAPLRSDELRMTGLKEITGVCSKGNSHTTNFTQAVITAFVQEIIKYTTFCFRLRQMTITCFSRVYMYYGCFLILQSLLVLLDDYCM